MGLKKKDSHIIIKEIKGDNMKNKSIWQENIVKTKFPTLSVNIECDTLIIGGGITGFSCAYFLRNSKEKIVLVESNKIANGATSKSTGKLTYLQEDLITKIKDIYDDDTYLKYVESQKGAISLAKKIILENKIRCDLEPVNSYIFSENLLKSKVIKKTYKLLKNNSSVKLKRKLPIKTVCHKSLEANDTFVFHPVKFVLGLSEIVKDKIDIYERTRVTQIDKQDNYFIAQTPNGNIKAKRIILALHYPFFINPFFFPFKTSIEKSFLVAGEVNRTRPFSAINVNKKVTSIRYYKSYKNYIILVSENGSLNSNVDNIKKQDDAIWKARSNFTPEIKYCWSNYDIMTSDHLPFIGELEENLYIATGYNTWGMTNGIIAGKVISDLIQNNDSIYKDLFNPRRDEKNIPNIIKFNLMNGLSFVNTKLNKNRLFYRKDVKIIKENGIYYGIYIDENKNVHKVYNQCPHMKCNLSFNYQTNTWDCPCHGSRFDVDGNIIYGPSVEDIKIKNSKN